MKTLIPLLIVGITLLGNLKTNPFKTNTITVTIENVNSSDGIVAAALYKDEDEFPGGEMFMGESKSLRSSGSIEITFENVPDGDYAIAIFHDANENEDIDMNDQGIPTEGFGFSNGAMGEMGPPDFDQAAFTVDGDLEMEIRLIYLNF
jgi:uncharacterized protein (DUF2141 family)